MHYSHKMFTILCLSGTALSLPAMAQEEEVPAVAQAFLDNIERQTTVEPDYESLEEDDDGTITIKNLTIQKPAQGTDPSIDVKIAETVLSDISEESEGLYQIGNARFSTLTMAMSGGDGFNMSLTMPDGSAEGWYLSEVGETPTPQEELRASMNVARKMTGGKTTVTAMGQTFSFDGYETTWNGDPKTGAGTFAMKVTNVAIPEGAIAMADPSGMLKQLGYSNLSFDIMSDGKMDIANDNMGMDMSFGIAGRDMANVKFNIAAADVPLAVYAEMQKAQKAGAEPNFTALMPQIQNISFSGFSFRFEDASLTKKLLPMLAAMQGMDEATLVASAGPMLQMGLMQLQNQEFAQQASAAVNSFLKDPKSLTIAAKPASPVKVSEIMAMDPNAPGAAITKLGVSVSAND